jgi:CheY-like chemotaxis protein
MMVVDDEEELAHLFMESLKGSGFNCVSFNDPLLALKHYSQNPEMYSLVLTDLRMPGMSGIEFAKKIRELNSNTKIILMTAFYSDDLLSNDDFKETVISEVMQKPIKLKELGPHVSTLF